MEWKIKLWNNQLDEFWAHKDKGIRFFSIAKLLDKRFIIKPCVSSIQFKLQNLILGSYSDDYRSSGIILLAAESYRFPIWTIVVHLKRKIRTFYQILIIQKRQVLISTIKQNFKSSGWNQLTFNSIA